MQNVFQNHKKVLHHCLTVASLAFATLRLLIAMVSQGTASAREVQQSFDFTLKCLEFMPNRRHGKVIFVADENVIIIMMSLITTRNICHGL